MPPAASDFFDLPCFDTMACVKHCQGMHGDTTIAHLRRRNDIPSPVVELSYHMSAHNSFFEMFVFANVLPTAETKTLHVLDVFQIIFQYGSAEDGDILTTADILTIDDHLPRVLDLMLPEFDTVCRYDEGGLIDMQRKARARGCTKPWTVYAWAEDTGLRDRVLQIADADPAKGRIANLVDHFKDALVPESRALLDVAVTSKMRHIDVVLTN